MAICIRLILLATVVQGATPDPGSLASANGFMLLTALLFDTTFVADFECCQAGPCGSGEPEVNAFMLAFGGRSRDSWHVSVGPKGPSNALHRADLASPSASIEGDIGIITWLPRLNC
jgi:hypothetical protein